MKYKVLDIFPIGMNIKDSDEKLYHLITVAMISSEEKNKTVVLIKGKFNSENIIA